MTLIFFWLSLIVEILGSGLRPHSANSDVIIRDLLMKQEMVKRCRQHI